MHKTNFFSILVEAKEAKADENSDTENKHKDEPKNGFALGRIPDYIIGAGDETGELMLAMKWKGTNEFEMVRAKEANKKCPQVVIKFYEQHLIWGMKPRETEKN